ncbi:hypothetical protein [Streptococcus hyovaginalis]|nr:hypothetical protein [Streptococcus suis]
MYISKTFKASKKGAFNPVGNMFKNGASSDAGITANIYKQIVAYANEKNLEIIKISNGDETIIDRIGISVIFKEK